MDSVEVSRRIISGTKSGVERMRTNSQLALWFREVLMLVSGGPVGECITLAQLAEVPPT